MGTKTIKVSKPVVVPVCDICGRQGHANDSLRRCYICRAEGCWSCHVGVQFQEREAHFVELFLPICKPCIAAGENVCGESFQSLVKAVMKDADAKLVELFERWGAWAKECKAKEATR